MIEARRRMRAAGDAGFTLIELLIAIVVVGILAAVVILGINGLRDSGETAACEASRDAATAAAAVHFANTGNHPASFTDMTDPADGGEPTLVLPGDTTATGATFSTNGWTLTMDTSGESPTFSCS